jgi:hypothetical protein
MCGAAPSSSMSRLGGCHVGGRQGTKREVGFRALALQVQRRDGCLHFKCKGHWLATGASWRNSREILRIAHLRACGTGPALPRDRTHGTRDLHRDRDRLVL